MTTEIKRREARRHTRVWAAIVACLVVAASLATAPASSAQTPTKGGSFTFLHAGVAPANWDTTSVGVGGNDGNTSQGIWLQAVYGFLAYEDSPNDRVVPSIAQSITSTSPTQWTVTLRPNVKFTDGTAYDAAAVKFNWERHQQKGKSLQHQTAMNIASMTVVNPTTLAVVLKEADVQFDRTVARNLTFIGSPTAMRADATKFRTNPVGAGPFKLQSFDGVTAVFTRNPKYFDAPRPYVDKLTIRVIADNNQRLNALRTGQGDAAYLSSPYSILAQAKSAGFRVDLNNPAGGGVMFLVNHKAAPFNDVVARKAIQLALNVGGAALTLDNSVTKPVTNLFPKNSVYYDAGASIPGYQARTAQLLINQYVREHDGKPLTITFYGHAGIASLLSYYQSQLREFDNLKINIRLVAPAQYVAGLAAGQFDIAQYPYAFTEPFQTTINMFDSKGSLNYGKYSNPEVDRLLDQAKGSLKLADRARLFKQVQRDMVNDQAFIFERTRPSPTVFGKNVQGVTYSIPGVPLWDRIWVNK